MSDTIIRYFPLLSDLQKKRLSQLKNIYEEWNKKINVISRKDIDNFEIHHVLHSLSIAKVITFLPGTRILDVGTGGGFPGIPLSIIFPDSEFTLLDSIGKKIKVVESVADELELQNVFASVKRAEDEKNKYDFIISRAVTGFPSFIKLTSSKIVPGGRNTFGNGIIYLKGGDLTEELKPFVNRVKVWNINEFFNESYFETKKILYMPV
jgi:16S rRNA (guanine527-N7)-methyltransferase